MKKTISLILALTMVLAMATTAFAADITTTGNTSAQVTATYKEGFNGGTIYGVNISWGNMTFTYTDASKGTWNADSHQYENPKAAEWTYDSGANVITVTNHSNAPIDVTPSWTAGEDYSAVTMTFQVNNVTATKLTVATADNGTDGAAGTAQTGTITVHPGGTLTKNDNTSATNGATIGQITLTLEDASAK